MLFWRQRPDDDLDVGMMANYLLSAHQRIEIIDGFASDLGRPADEKCSTGGGYGLAYCYQYRQITPRRFQDVRSSSRSLAQLGARRQPIVSHQAEPASSQSRGGNRKYAHRWA
jgi:hypothetical protein